MAYTVLINTREPGVYVVRPRGAIDTVTAPELDKALAPLLVATTKVIVVNMSDVDHISSMGLGVIFKAQRFLEENGKAFMMTDLSPRVKRVFELVKAIPKYLFASMTEVDACLDAFLNEMEKLEEDKRSGSSGGSLA